MSKRKKPKPQKETPPEGNPPSPLALVKPEESPEPSAVRPLSAVQALQYKFAILQEELLGEKKNLVRLKRVIARKDEEILALRRETVDLKETLVAREERDLFRDNRVLLQRLGVGDGEEVLIEDGHLFVAPKGTAQTRKANG